MRPLSLQISGLNSFRKSVSIDFDTLLKDGLFGIFGPTGSGKSTILDAITLALYGKVRRAPGGMQGIVNMGEQRCSVGFSFSIGESAARRLCTVERLLARNAKTGGVETRKVRLAVYRDGVLERVGEKGNELQEMVNDIVGINVDDFLRAVVLPQGAFADFLTLKATERTAVLQRLFGLYQLGDQLNIVLKQHAQDLQEAHAQLQGRLQDLRAYDDEALAACHEMVRDAERGHVEARDALRAVEARHSEAIGLHALIVERDALMNDEDSRAAASEKLRELRDRIELAERANAVAPALTTVASARDRYVEARGRHEEAVRESNASAEHLAEAQARFVAAREVHGQRHQTLHDEVGELKQLMGMEADLAARRERHREMSGALEGAVAEFERQSRLREDAHADIGRLEGEIAAIDRRIEELTMSADERGLLHELHMSIQTQRNLTRELSAGERDVATINGEIEAAALALSAAREEESIRERDAAAARAELATLKGRLADATRSIEELRGELQRLKEPMGRIEMHEKNLAAYEAELRTLREKVAGARGALDREAILLKDAHARETTLRQERAGIVQSRDGQHRQFALASLAEHLEDGVPCPLCGALEHLTPFHTGGIAAEELEVAERALADADIRVREAEEVRGRAEASFARSEAALQHLAADAAERETKMAGMRESIAEALRDLDAGHPVSDREDLRSRIDAVTARGLAARKSIEDLTAAIETQEARVAAADSARAAAGERRVRLEADLSAKQARWGELDRSCVDLRVRLATEAASFAKRSNGRTLEVAEEAVRRMLENDRSIEEVQAGARDLRSRLQTDRSTLGELDNRKNEAGSRRDGLDGQLRGLETDMALIAERLGAGLEALVPPAERSLRIADLVAGREAARDRIQREFDEARERYDSASADAQVLRERVNTCWNTLCRDEKDFDEAERACTALLQQHGFASIAEAAAGGLQPADLRLRREEAHAIEEALERTRRRVMELGELIAGRRITGDEVMALNADLERVKSVDEEALRALGAAQEKLRECRQKNIEWKNVSQQDVFSSEGKATADQLAKYLRGNGFVDFLANERLAEICRRASMQLDHLTAGRFELDARPKEGFIIRDNGNGGGERSPSSLSGGETFLVSLSLAIALSDTIQLGHSPLEFFFLDEGFGTLDSDLLETVMNTLDRLRSKHRAIGVISHVAQLRERISRRLIVTPANDTEGSTVRYELA